MSLSVSPPVRIVALLGGVLAVAAGLFAFTQRPSESSPAAPAAVAKPAPAPAAARPGTAPAKPAVKPAVKLDGDLPPALATALTQDEVVVVSLYVPGARVDELATAEARAGAELGGVGFLALNVLDEESAGPLLAKLGVLEDRSVLVFTRPGVVAVRMAGFADRETVAQAASNAAS